MNNFVFRGVQNSRQGKPGKPCYNLRMNAFKLNSQNASHRHTYPVHTLVGEYK